MPKVNKEKASDATINPPHPGDPTSDVTRDGGNPLHKAPQAGAWMDAEGVWHAAEEHEDYVGEDVETGDTSAAVPGFVGQADDGSTPSPFLGDSEQAQAWREDPMPEGAQERLDWAGRGTDGEGRINAALAAEQSRPRGTRTTVVSGLERLREERDAQ
ncbi:MAG: hypothetical protein V4515_14390 [Chloroflexota bacterium]